MFCINTCRHYSTVMACEGVQRRTECIHDDSWSVRTPHGFIRRTKVPAPSATGWEFSVLKSWGAECRWRDLGLLLYEALWDPSRELKGSHENPLHRFTFFLCTAWLPSALQSTLAALPHPAIGQTAMSVGEEQGGLDEFLDGIYSYYF